MVALGFLSLLQLTILPGLIATRLMKLSGLGRNLFFAFFLSPIFNYSWVFLATILGIYNRGTTFCLLLAEVLLLAYLWHSAIDSTLGKLVSLTKLRGRLDFLFRGRTVDFKDLIYAVVWVIALYRLWFLVTHYGSQWNAAFTAWDAVVSWDRWAIDWFNNRLPSLMWHYPQLIPANWSLTYQLVGDSRVKWFAKDFMYAFELAALIVPLYLALVKREVGYCAGGILASLLLWRLGSNGNGYVDTAVAVFGFAPLVALLLSKSEQGPARSRSVLLGAILAAGAALTKQAGLWIGLVYPLIYVGFVEKRLSRQVVRNLALVLLIYAALIGSWYGYQETRIARGADASEIPLISADDLHQERGTLERLQHAGGLLDAGLGDSRLPRLTGIDFLGSGYFYLLCLLLLMSFGLRQEFSRWLMLAEIVPIAIIWALNLEYDTRNLALIWPAVALVGGMGLQEIIARLPTAKVAARGIVFQPFRHRLPARLQSIRVVWLLLLLVPMAFALQAPYPDSWVVANAKKQQRQIGDPVVNESIYEFKRRSGLDGKILSDYQFLEYLPGLESFYVFALSRTRGSEFIQLLNDPQVGYALVHDGVMAADVKAFVEDHLADGSFAVLFESQGWRFLSTCGGPCQ